ECRGQEWQPGRAQDEPRQRQPRLDRTPPLGGKLFEVAPGLRNRTLGVLEEGNLGLIPTPSVLAAEGDDAVLWGRGSAPHAQVAALIVADAGLGTDVAGDHRNLPVRRDGQPRSVQ